MNFWLKRSLLWVMAAAFVTGCSNNDDVSSDSEQEGSAGTPPVAVQSAVPSDLKLVDGGSSRVFPLSALFTDADTAISALQFSVDNPFPSVVGVTVSNGTLTIQPLSASDQLVTVVVQARDDNGVASLVLQIEVQRPEDVPSNTTLRRPLPDLVVADGASRRLDLSPFFSAENGFDLVYTVERIDGQTARGFINGQTLNLTADSLGASTFRITATGSDGESAFDTLAATVSDQGAAPVVLFQPAAIALEIGDSASPVDLGQLFIDDRDAPQFLSYEVQSLNTAIATVRVESGLLLVSGKQTSGSTTVVVTAVDTEGLQSSPLIIPVGVGRAPTGTLADITVPAQCPGRNDCPTIAANLASAFTDPDGDNLDFRLVEISNPTAVSVSISVSGLLQVTTQAADASTLVVVEAVDEIGLTGMASFTVTVDNQAPVVDADGVPSQTLSSGGPNSSRSVNLDAFVSDREDSSLSYSVVANSAPSVVTAAGNASGISLEAGDIGSSQLTVRASDSGGEFVQFTLPVTVNQLNNPPQIISGIDDIGLAPSAENTITLGTIFADEMIDTVAYSITSSDTSVATISESEGLLTIEAGTEIGSTLVSLAATDDAGQSSQPLRFLVVVSTPPTVSAGIADQVDGADAPGAIQAKGARLFNLAAVFADAEDGEPVSYQVNVVDDNIATANVSGTTLVVRGGLNDGITVVSVTATDSAGLTVQDSFQVEIVNQAPRAFDPVASPTPSPTPTPAPGGGIFDFPFGGFTKGSPSQAAYTKATPVDVGTFTATLNSTQTIQLGNYISDREDDLSSLAFSIISNSRPQSATTAINASSLSLNAQQLTPQCDLASPTTVDCVAVRFRATDSGGKDADGVLYFDVDGTAAPQVLQGVPNTIIRTDDTFSLDVSTIFRDDTLATSEMIYEVRGERIDNSGSGLFTLNPEPTPVPSPAPSPAPTQTDCALSLANADVIGDLRLGSTVVFSPTGINQTAYQLVAKDPNAAQDSEEQCSQVVSFVLEAAQGPEYIGDDSGFNLLPSTVRVRANRRQGRDDSGVSFSEVLCDSQAQFCDPDDTLFSAMGPSSATLSPASVVELVGNSLRFTTQATDAIFDASITVTDQKGLSVTRDFIIEVENNPPFLTFFSPPLPAGATYNQPVLDLGAIEKGSQAQTIFLADFYEDFEEPTRKPTRYEVVRTDFATAVASTSVTSDRLSITVPANSTGQAATEYNIRIRAIDSGGEFSGQFDELVVRFQVSEPPPAP